MAVQEVFLELREKELVKKACKCRQWRVDNFKAGVIFRRTIFYNKKYADLDKDCLRFALLHEEGHLCKKQYSHLVIGLDVVVIILSILAVNYIASGHSSMVSPVLYGLLPLWVWLILVSFRIFSEPIQCEETASDLFAARNLKDAYGIGQPSIIADRLFELITSPMTDSFADRLYFLFFGGMHPSNDERVKRIKEMVDDRPATGHGDTGNS